MPKDRKNNVKLQPRTRSITDLSAEAYLFYRQMLLEARADRQAATGQEAMPFPPGIGEADMLRPGYPGSPNEKEHEGV